MTTARVQPHLKVQGAALTAAMKRANMNNGAVAKHMNVTAATVSNWRCARSRIRPEAAAKLNTLLGVDPATLAGRDADSGGPARRAAALHASRDSIVEHLPVLTPSRAPRVADGIFGMEARADGTMAIWLRATLPVERGIPLLKTLLDLDLVHAEETHPDAGPKTPNTE